MERRFGRCLMMAGSVLAVSWFPIAPAFAQALSPGVGGKKSNGAYIGLAPRTGIGCRRRADLLLRPRQDGHPDLSGVFFSKRRGKK